MKNQFLDENSEIDVDGATEIAGADLLRTEMLPGRLEEESEEFEQTSVLPLDGNDDDATAIGDAIDGRFRILGVLGEGGMGKVYRGIQLSINRDVAIKVVREEFAHEPQLRARFEREAQLISGFTHPNIVRLVDFGESEGRLYLAMEFVNGKPLSDLFNRKQLHPRYAVEIIKQIASALTEAHGKGVVHRDLKPDNVLLSRVADGSVQLKVLDFGVARTGSSNLTAAGAVCGTPEYMPPEQARGMTVGSQADLYALGVMMFELLCGRPPFEGGNAMSIMIRHVKELPPRVRDLAPHVPEEIEDVVASLLEKNPQDRIQSAIMLCDTLDHLMSQFGWNQSIRIAEGPLNETVAKWVYDGSAIRAGGSSQSASLLPSPNTSQGFTAASNTPAPQPQSQAPSAMFSAMADRELSSFGASNEPLMLDQSILDDRRNPPATGAPTPAAKHQAQPQPQPQMQRQEGRARTMTEPSRAERTERPSPARNVPSAPASNKANIILTGVVVVLLIAAVIVGVMVVQRSAGGPSVDVAQLGTGQAPQILMKIAAAKWEPAPVVTSTLGSVNIQTSRVVKDGQELSVSIYTCQNEDEQKTIFDSIFLPSMGYTWDNMVVLIEPRGEVPRSSVEQILGVVQAAYPNGKTSVVGIR